MDVVQQPEVLAPSARCSLPKKYIANVVHSKTLASRHAASYGSFATAWFVFASAAGTTLSVAKTFDGATCQNTPMTPVTNRDALLRSGGDKYWIDANNCLHLKLTDPGHPWQYTDSFARDGLYVEEEVRASMHLRCLLTCLLTFMAHVSIDYAKPSIHCRCQPAQGATSVATAQLSNASTRQTLLITQDCGMRPACVLVRYVCWNTC
jgi:hypothetical protein